MGLGPLLTSSTMKRNWQKECRIWGQTRCVLVRNPADTPVPPLIPDLTCGLLQPNMVTGTVFGCRRGK